MARWSWGRSTAPRRGSCRGSAQRANLLVDPGEEIGLRDARLDLRRREDVGLLRPAFLPALEAERHEAAVLAELGDVLVEGLPLRLHRGPADVHPGRDPLVRDEHLGCPGLPLRDLFRTGVLGRVPEALLATLLQGCVHPLAD